MLNPGIVWREFLSNSDACDFHSISPRSRSSNWFRQLQVARCGASRVRVIPEALLATRSVHEPSTKIRRFPTSPTIRKTLAVPNTTSAGFAPSQCP